MKYILFLLLLWPTIFFAQNWHTYCLDKKKELCQKKANEIYLEIESQIPINRRPFIKRFGWLAIYEYNEYNVLASIKLAQGGLECGWGLILDRGLKANNYFSIKCREKKHSGVNCFALNDAGELHHFVKYKTPFDSWRAHTLHLIKYYPELFQYNSYDEWAKILSKRYAVDQSYKSKLISIIQTHLLFKYDIKLKLFILYRNQIFMANFSLTIKKEDELYCI